MTEEQRNNRYLDMAIDEAAELVNNAAAAMEAKAQELRRYAKDIQEYTDDRIGCRAERLSWALNSILGLNSAMRLDMFVTRAHELASAEAKARQAK